MIVTVSWKEERAQFGLKPTEFGQNTGCNLVNKFGQLKATFH